MQYTREQVLRMAPDDSAAKAGQQLANNAKWPQKSISDTTLWGDCQGSGKTPYKTIVDLNNVAFKCSCPSRKFPCKHGLGLLLLYLQQPDAFTPESTLPQHVAEWLGKRAVRGATKEQKEQKPVDETARAKRVASRDKKVESGIEELRAWIQDVVRTGIMQVPQQVPRFSQHITARMVDAQAGGLAARLRQINRIGFFQDGWQKQLMRKLSHIYLITEAFGRADQLPDDMAAELQQLVGYTVPKEEVLRQEAVSDTWIVLSITTTEEANIRTEQVWLYGIATRRYALLLHFYAGNQLPQHTLFPGLYIKADLVFYPGIAQTRALIREQQVLQADTVALPGMPNLLQVYEQIAAVLAKNPFTEQVPFLSEKVSLVRKDKTWLLADGNGQGILLHNTEAECWYMLAVTCGKAFTCFGIYESAQFRLHTIWAGSKMYSIK